MTSHIDTDHPCHDTIVIAPCGRCGIIARCGNCGIDEHIGVGSSAIRLGEISLPELVAWLDNHCEDSAAGRD